MFFKLYLLPPFFSFCAYFTILPFDFLHINFFTCNVRFFCFHLCDFSTSFLFLLFFYVRVDARCFEVAIRGFPVRVAGDSDKQIFSSFASANLKNARPERLFERSEFAQRADKAFERRAAKQ